MGWTYTYKPKGKKVLDFFKERWDSDQAEVLGCATKNMVAYIAFRDKQTKAVAAFICKVHYSRNPQYNFGFKDMDETMGPLYYDCPERILSLLTPIENERANEWRKICWEQIEKRKKQGKIAKGVIIIASHPAP